MHRGRIAVIYLWMFDTKGGGKCFILNDLIMCSFLPQNNNRMHRMGNCSSRHPYFRFTVKSTHNGRVIRIGNSLSINHFWFLIFIRKMNGHMKLNLLHWHCLLAIEHRRLNRWNTRSGCSMENEMMARWCQCELNTRRHDTQYKIKQNKNSSKMHFTHQKLQFVLLSNCVFD